MRASKQKMSMLLRLNKPVRRSKPTVELHAGMCHQWSQFSTLKNQLRGNSSALEKQTLVSVFLLPFCLSAGRKLPFCRLPQALKTGRRAEKF
jgi:hypothetical protein